MKTTICLIVCFVAVVTECHRGHGGRGGGMGFMRDLSDEVRQQFKEIMHDSSLSIEEKQQKAMELAQTVLTPEQLEKFTEMQAKMAERHQEMEAKIAALSENAKAAMESIKELMMNDMTWQERREAIRAIKDTLTESEQEELGALRGGRGHGKGRGFRGGKGGFGGPRPAPVQDQ